MPTPMKYDDAVRLCGVPQNVGSPVGVREVLLGRFGMAQGARSGSFADRERVYLVTEGSKVGDSRGGLWATHVGNTRPFTDGMKGLSGMPSVVAQGWVRPPNDLYVGYLEGEGSYTRMLKRTYVGMADGGALGGSVVSDSTYRKN